MRVTAAVLYDTKKRVVEEDVELLEPGPDEVQARWADDHRWRSCADALEAPFGDRCGQALTAVQSTRGTRQVPAARIAGRTGLGSREGLTT
jgi:hypothetical protein